MGNGLGMELPARAGALIGARKCRLLAKELSSGVFGPAPAPSDTLPHAPKACSWRHYSLDKSMTLREASIDPVRLRRIRSGLALHLRSRAPMAAWSALHFQLDLWAGSVSARLGARSSAVAVR